MGLELSYFEGQAPLDEDEKEGLLITSITTRGELDQHEQLNIEKAIEWTIRHRFRKKRIFSEDFVCNVHKRMFGDTWSWVGSFRKSDTNIGVEWTRIGVEKFDKVRSTYLQALKEADQGNIDALLKFARG